MTRPTDQARRVQQGREPLAAAKRKQPQASAQRRWTWLVSIMGTVAVIGLAGLVWSRSDGGQAALLHLGADALHGTVQARVDSVLVRTLPSYQPGPASGDLPADAHDWPLPGDAILATIRCRVVPVARQDAWWQVQARIDAAVREVGARVLWSERLDRRVRGAARPDEQRDLLRLDLGVPGHATHTLVLYRDQTARPDVRWGGDPSLGAWRQLQALADAPRVAIVIDDWGYRQDATTRGLQELPVPLTMSVLPGLAYSRKFALDATELALPAAQGRGAADDAADAAARRQAAGAPVTLGLGHQADRLDPRRREVMLHLPMQPVGYPDVDPGPDAVLVGMPQDAIAALVDQALASLPNVRGINNHQGSAATADQATMDALMAVLRERDLFFLDSLTAAGSVAYQTARAAGLPAARNRIFLDDDHDNPAAIRDRLQRLVRSARSGGAAIAIGHPHPATLEVLQQELPRLVADGVCFVTMSELLALEAAQ
jgi:polysaccharide deacetylase 2 family uncharacterized protein YibQ